MLQAFRYGVSVELDSLRHHEGAARAVRDCWLPEQPERPSSDSIFLGAIMMVFGDGKAQTFANAYLTALRKSFIDVHPAQQISNTLTPHTLPVPMTPETSSQLDLQHAVRNEWNQPRWTDTQSVTRSHNHLQPPSPSPRFPQTPQHAAPAPPTTTTLNPAAP